jgi:ABC-2 type transport system permease protein
MTRLARIYVQQFKTTFALTLQYRAGIAIWMIGHVLEPLVTLVVWTVVARTRGGDVSGFSEKSFAAYFIVLMVVNHITYTWIMYEYEYRIRHGALSFALLRPLHPIHTDIADNVSSKTVTFPGILIAAAVLAFLFRPSFRMIPWAVALAVPALVLAFLLRFLVEWSLAQSAFWTTRVSAVNQTYFAIMLFFSGQIAPFALLPGWVRILATFLPFRWMIGFPVELILGRLTPAQGAFGLAVQTLWVLVTLGLIRGIWHAGLRRYSAVGG